MKKSFALFIYIKHSRYVNLHQFSASNRANILERQCLPTCSQYCDISMITFDVVFVCIPEDLFGCGVSEIGSYWCCNSWTLSIFFRASRLYWIKLLTKSVRFYFKVYLENMKKKNQDRVNSRSLLGYKRVGYIDKNLSSTSLYYEEIFAVPNFMKPAEDFFTIDLVFEWTVAKGKKN